MEISRSSAKIFAAKFGSSIFGFIAIAVFAQQLGSEILGQFFLYQGLVYLLSQGADFGFRSATVKRISEGSERGAFASSSILVKLVPLTIVCSGTLVAAPHINRYIGLNIAVLIAVTIFVREYAQLALQIVEAELRVGETAIIIFFRQLTWICIGYALLGWGAIGLITAWIASHFLVLVWAGWKIQIDFQRPSLYHADSLFQFAKFQFVSSLGGLSFNWVDSLVIGFFITSAAVGSYEIAWRVTSIPLIITGAIATTIFPQISSQDLMEEAESIGYLISSVIVPAVVFIIPTFFGAYLFADEILRFVFSPEYTAATNALIVLVGSQIFQAFYMVFGRALRALDHIKASVKIEVGAIVINVILNLLLVPAFGLLGAAFATTSAVLFNSVIHYLYLSRIVPLHLPLGQLRTVILGSIGMAVILLGAETVIEVDSLISLLIVVVCGAGTYTIFILIDSSIRTKAIDIYKGIA